MPATSYGWRKPTSSTTSKRSRRESRRKCCFCRRKPICCSRPSCHANGPTSCASRATTSSSTRSTAPMAISTGCFQSARSRITSAPSWTNRNRGLAPIFLFRPRLRLGTPADGDAGVHILALALHFHRRRRAWSESGDEVQHRRGIGDRLALHLEQDIARLDAGLVGGPAAQHPGDERASRAGELEGFGDRRRDLLHFG